jgi:hypothetical protein
MADDQLSEPPLLKIEMGRKRCLVQPDEAVRIRDGLRREGNLAGARLATIIDAKATELLAAPLYAGTVSVRLDLDEEASLRLLLTGWAGDGSISAGTGQLWNLWCELSTD